MKKVFKITPEAIKGILFSFVISISLWIFTTLNSEYTTYIKVPLAINPPERLSIAGTVPDKIDIQITATGWQILNLSFFPKTSVCKINFDRVDVQGNKLILTKNELLKGLSLSVNAKVHDVIPAILTFEVGQVAEKIVPVISRIKITTRENFTLVGKPVIKPDLIVVRGEKEILDKINAWPTKWLTLEDVYQPLDIEIPLLDTLHALVSLNTDKVRLYADVDLTCEKELLDVPVRIEGGELPENHSIEPRILKVVVRSGVNNLVSKDLSSVVAAIPYQEIAKDTIGILTPRIDLPDGIKLLYTNPAYVFHWKKSVVR